jgi:magnesium transporter
VKINVFDAHGVHEIPVEELSTTLEASGRVIWADMTGPNAYEIDILKNIFEFHSLAIEDTRNERQRPKIERYPEYLFGILNPVRVNAHSDGLVFREVNFFLGHEYLVTVHRSSDPIINETRNRIVDAQRRGSVSCGYLLYVLVDVVVDTYFPVLDFIEDEIEALETQMITRPRQDLLNRLFRLKRNVAELSRVVRQQRQMFNLLTRRDLSLLDQETLGFHLRDVSDHLTQIADMVETFRDLMNGVVDLYMSTASNRVNQVVTRLTVVTICIGILTVISGFYGMNFERTWPAFTSEWGVPFVIALMIISVSVVLWIFKERRLY